MTTTNLTWGLGRRKTSTARVRIQPGAGAFFVNGRSLDNFFPVLEHRNRALSPLKLLEGVQYDVFATVDGGGLIGQADAIRLGLAPASVLALRELEAATSAATTVLLALLHARVTRQVTATAQT